MIQSENWRGARDTARDVMQSGTGQIYRYRTGTGTSPNSTETGTRPDWNRNSGRVLASTDLPLN